MALLSKKICLLGEFAVGKTSLVRRFVYNRFDDKYLSTIGVNVSRKKVAVASRGEAIEVNLMLWDLAGSEEFSQVRASYLRGANGAVLVCDLTRRRTVDNLENYLTDLFTVSPGARLVVAANKRDLADQYEVSPEDVQAVASRLQAPCYFTSAKEGDDVDEMFRYLGKLFTL